MSDDRGGEREPLGRDVRRQVLVFSGIVGAAATAAGGALIIWAAQDTDNSSVLVWALAYLFFFGGLVVFAIRSLRAYRGLRRRDGYPRRAGPLLALATSLSVAVGAVAYVAFVAFFDFWFGFVMFVSVCLGTLWWDIGKEAVRRRRSPGADAEHPAGHGG